MDDQRGAELVSRRDALKRALFGAAGLALTSRGFAAAPTTAKPAASGAKPAKAKAVIQIWMWGGPPHLDTFDPKPEAGRDYCCPLNRPIETNEIGRAHV